MILDATFEILSGYKIPVTDDSRRWFDQGRQDRRKSKEPNTVADKKRQALTNLVKFKAWGLAPREAGWLYEHKLMSEAAKKPAEVYMAPAPASTRDCREAEFFARRIASRHGEFI